MPPGAERVPLRRFADRAMGSPLRLTVTGGSARDGQRAWLAARGEMAHAEADLSRFRAGSALSRANQLAGSPAWFPAASRLRQMLTLSRRAMGATNGRFDPRVIHALEAIGEAGGVRLPASATATAGAWLERDGRAARFRMAAAADSGGIGKGLGLRWSLAAARSAAPAVRGLLLDAGGDIVTWGRGPEHRGWSVGIEDPASREELMATIRVTGGAVATSSIGRRTWLRDGRRVHHLIDPRTGEPAATGLVAVTIAMPDPAWAEVWTKALFLAGREAIGPEARARGFAAWWVEDDGSLHMTPAAREMTTWVRAEATAA